MKILLFYLFIAAIFTTTQAQVVKELKKAVSKERASQDSNGWKRAGVFVLNINQSAQSDWGSGGENFQIGINAILNKAIHHRKGKYTFDTYLDLELGLVEASSFKQFRKTNDRFDLTFEMEHNIGKNTHFAYGILTNINTQLFTGNNYIKEDHPKISNFFSPGKILIAPGIDYKNTNDNRFFGLFISPATIRWVTKLDKDFYHKNLFGVDSFHRVYTEIGAYLSFHYNNKISKTTSLISRLDLFSNYRRNPQNVDLLFNNVLIFNIGKSFVGTFLLDIVYDHNVKSRTQIQQIMGLGLRLKF